MGQKQKAELAIRALVDRKRGYQNTVAETSRAVLAVEDEIRDVLSDIRQFCTDFSVNHLGQSGIRQGAKLMVQQPTGGPAGSAAELKGYLAAIKVIYGKHIRKDLANQIQGRLAAGTTNEPAQLLLQQVQRILNSKQLRLVQPKRALDKEQSIAHQREYLEKSVKTLEKSLERRRQQLNQAIEKARQQSGTLLCFSNLMRRENKELQQKVRDAKFQLARKRQDLQALSADLFGSVLDAATPRCGSPAGAGSAEGGLGEFAGKKLDQVLEEQFHVDGERVPFVGAAGGPGETGLGVPGPLPRIGRN